MARRPVAGGVPWQSPVNLPPARYLLSTCLIYLPSLARRGSRPTQEGVAPDGEGVAPDGEGVAGER